MTCPPGPAFGEYCERAWVELTYPCAPQGLVYCLLNDFLQSRVRHEIIMMQQLRNNAGADLLAK